MSMNAVALIDTRKMEQAAWLEARRVILGGSDIPKVLGLSQYGTKFTVFLDKRGELPHDEPGEAAYWGNTLEEIVAQEFTKRSGMKVRRCNKIMVHPERQWMGANVDRLIVGKDEGLECKTASAYLSSKWVDDELPDEYYAQVQWYMGVTGYRAWWIAVLIGGQKFVFKRVVRDESFIEQMVAIADDFWNNHVVPGIPPEMDGSEAADKYLTQLHPQSNGTSIELPSDAQTLVERYLESKQDEKEAGDRKALYENQLKALMGDNEVGFSDQHKVTWKTIERSEYVVKATSYRKFNVK